MRARQSVVQASPLSRFSLGNINHASSSSFATRLSRHDCEFAHESPLSRFSLGKTVSLSRFSFVTLLSWQDVPSLALVICRASLIAIFSVFHASHLSRFSLDKKIRPSRFSFVPPLPWQDDPSFTLRLLSRLCLGEHESLRA